MAKIFFNDEKKAIHGVYIIYMYLKCFAHIVSKQNKFNLAFIITS